MFMSVVYRAQGDSQGSGCVVMSVVYRGRQGVGLWSCL